MTAPSAIGSRRRTVQRGPAGPGNVPLCGLAQALLDYAPTAVAVIGTGPMEVNPAFRSIFGYGPDASLEDLSLLFLPDARERLRASLQSVLAGSGPQVTLDAIGVRSDGSQFPTRLTAARTVGAGAVLGVVYVVDLSEQEQARAVVRLTTERLSAIVENAPLPIVSFDRGGAVQSWNAAAERVLGWPADSVIGQPYPSGAGLVSGEGIAGLVADGVPLEGVEMLGASADGTLRDFSVWAAPLRDESDEVVGAVALLDDVTERNRLERDLRTALGQKQALETKLTYQAMHDPLTGLANRRRFLEAAAEVPGGQWPAVLLLDLDDFKAVNDTYGHQVGDALLVGIAGRLRASLRGSDLAARLGGDEFGVLLPGCASPFAASEIANRILLAIEEPFELDGHLLFAHASIGIARADEHADEVADLLSQADVAMYLAKGQGKGRIEVYQATMHADVVQRIALRADLEEAIAARQFVLHYQPVYAIEDGRLQSVEALVRWNHPTRGLLSPADFIELANETGLIVPLGRWILHDACRQMAAWRTAWTHAESLELSINISAVQIRHPSFADDLRAALDDNRIPAARLVLELTQSVLTDSVAVMRTLEELKAIGVRLAIDDFGAGYAPLSYVGRFPIDILKIDRSFIAALGTTAREATLAQTIIELAGSLHLKTVAEGIEQPEQLDILRTMGCQMGQGFYLARPMTVGGMDELVRDRVPLATVA